MFSSLPYNRYCETFGSCCELHWYVFVANLLHPFANRQHTSTNKRWWQQCFAQTKYNVVNALWLRTHGVVFHLHCTQEHCQKYTQFNPLRHSWFPPTRFIHSANQSKLDQKISAAEFYLFLKKCFSFSYFLSVSLFFFLSLAHTLSLPLSLSPRDVDSAGDRPIKIGRRPWQHWAVTTIRYTTLNVSCIWIYIQLNDRLTAIFCCHRPMRCPLPVLRNRRQMGPTTVDANNCINAVPCHCVRRIFTAPSRPRKRRPTTMIWTMPTLLCGVRSWPTFVSKNWKKLEPWSVVISIPLHEGYGCTMPNLSNNGPMSWKECSTHRKNWFSKSSNKPKKLKNDLHRCAAGITAWCHPIYSAWCWGEERERMV